MVVLLWRKKHKAHPEHQHYICFEPKKNKVTRSNQTAPQVCSTPTTSQKHSSQSHHSLQPHLATSWVWLRNSRETKESWFRRAYSSDLTGSHRNPAQPSRLGQIYSSIYCRHHVESHLDASDCRQLLENSCSLPRPWERHFPRSCSRAEVMAANFYSSSVLVGVNEKVSIRRAALRKVSSIKSFGPSFHTHYYVQFTRLNSRFKIIDSQTFVKLSPFSVKRVRQLGIRPATAAAFLACAGSQISEFSSWCQECQ